MKEVCHGVVPVLQPAPIVNPGGDCFACASLAMVRYFCAPLDPDAMFVTGAAQNQAKITCYPCPIRLACLADALDNRAEFGVWGGMTERERRALLRRSPQVRSWRALLNGAGHAHRVR